MPPPIDVCLIFAKFTEGLQLQFEKPSINFNKNSAGMSYDRRAQFISRFKHKRLF